MSFKTKLKGAKRDLMMWIATLGALAGIFQGVTMYLQPFIDEHPKGWGIVLAGLAALAGISRWVNSCSLMQKGAADGTDPQA